MTFSEAASAETTFESREAKRSLDIIQQEFDTFQADIMIPLHALLSERIVKASAAIEQLRSGLCTTANDRSPNQPQEEGDERPELLEKLTLLKWLFEAREALHRALFELECERNERYKSIILTSYTLSSPPNTIKQREAEAFFSRDSQDRHHLFEKEMVKRAEEIANLIEAHVTRGVEDQLCAFWDIAPSLLDVVQKVPAEERRLEGFEVLIPTHEVQENPQYEEFPLQYLYSLLLHAERAAYQYIESQTNLLCLLHEVRTLVMVSGSKVLERQRMLEGEAEEAVRGEMEEVRRGEERELTRDLKEKVRTVESQWKEALGRGLAECMERAEGVLRGRGGWDEGLKE